MSVSDIVPTLPTMGWEPLPTDTGEDPAPIAAGLDRVVRRLGAPSLGVTDDVFQRWSDLVGETVGANCRPVSLRDGTLVVAVVDPAWATQLTFLERTLLDQLDEHLGAGAITSIDVRVRGSGPSKSIR